MWYYAILCDIVWIVNIIWLPCIKPGTAPPPPEKQSQTMSYPILWETSVISNPRGIFDSRAIQTPMIFKWDSIASCLQGECHPFHCIKDWGQNQVLQLNEGEAYIHKTGHWTHQLKPNALKTGVAWSLFPHTKHSHPIRWGFNRIRKYFCASLIEIHC